MTDPSCCRKRFLDNVIAKHAHDKATNEKASNERKHWRAYLVGTKAGAVSIATKHFVTRKF